MPHTDRTSAFYLAMIRAAEAVGGLVRAASRPEMGLLVQAGALAKGASCSRSWPQRLCSWAVANPS